MTPRLPTGPPERKCQSRSEWNLYAHEAAMEALLGRDAEAFAHSLRITGRSLRDWRQRYHGDGEPPMEGPGRRLATMIRFALDALDRPREQALAPLRALASEFGLRLIDEDAPAAVASAGKTAGDFAREFAEALAVFTERIHGAEPQPEDLARFQREWEEMDVASRTWRAAVLAHARGPVPMRGAAELRRSEAG